MTMIKNLLKAEQLQAHIRIKKEKHLKRNQHRQVQPCKKNHSQLNQNKINKAIKIIKVIKTTQVSKKKHCLDHLYLRSSQWFRIRNLKLMKLYVNLVSRIGMLIKFLLLSSIKSIKDMMMSLNICLDLNQR